MSRNVPDPVSASDNSLRDDEQAVQQGVVQEPEQDVNKKLIEEGEQTKQPLLEQPLTLRIPEGARIPAGASFYEGEDDGRCRVIRADGERCRSTRMRAYGLCPGHAGKGGVALDPSGNSRLAHAERSRRKQTRLALGISTRRAAQPVQAARLAAQLRADDYARAVVDGPLDDPELGSVARQQAAIRALELLYPQVHASVEVSLPEEADEVASMGWQEMQALAQTLTSPDQ